LVLSGLLENESEDEAEDREGFGQSQTKERDRLEHALGFRLTCNAVDVSGNTRPTPIPPPIAERP